MVRLWDGSDLTKPLHSFEKSFELAVVGVDFSGDGKQVVTSSLDGYCRVFDVESKQKIHQIDSGPAGTWDIAHHPSLALFASGKKSGGVKVYDTTTGEGKMDMESKDGQFSMCVAYSPDGACLASGDANGAVHIFDTATGKTLQQLGGHTRPVRSVAFSTDSQLLFTGSEDKHTSVFDVKNGQQVAHMSTHLSWVLAVAVSPAAGSNSSILATAGADKKVKVWDWQQRESLFCSDAHTEQAWNLAYNQDGTRLVSVGDDGALNMYNISD